MKCCFVRDSCSRFEKKQKERRLQKNVEMANTSVQLIKDSQFDMSVFKEQLSKMLEDDSKKRRGR